MVLELDQVDLAQLVAEFSALPACRHHWIIEPANGQFSQGECRRCHQVRDFQNSITEADPE